MADPRAPETVMPTGMSTSTSAVSSAANGAAEPQLSARPTVLSLSIKEKAAMYAAYMPFLKNGGIFVPTTKHYKIGDEIYLILALMDDPNKYPLAGRVAWITPSGANNNKTQGIGLQFPEDETGQRVKARIEDILGGALRSTRATHTL